MESSPEVVPEIRCPVVARPEVRPPKPSYGELEEKDDDDDADEATYNVPISDRELVATKLAEV